MIEGYARVVEVDRDWLLLEPERRSACGGCAASAGCGSGALATLFDRRGKRLRLPNSIDAQVGDRVVLGIDESALVRGSLMVYLLPIITMLLAALVVESLSGGRATGSDWPVMVAAAAGLATGFAIVSLQRWRDNSRYLPQLLRCESPGANGSCQVEIYPTDPI